MVLKILGGVVALGLGIYFGMAGQYNPDPEDLEQSLRPGGRTRRVKRAFTPLGWLRGRLESPSRARRFGGASRSFNLVAPDAPKPDAPKKEDPDKTIRL